MKIIGSILSALMLCFFTFSGALAQKESIHTHAKWNELLQANVDANGAVNYAAFQENKAQLNAYLKELEKNPVQAGWSRNQIMAYWINAYNAFTVKLIVDNYPVKSIKDLHSGKPWDVKWIKLGKKTYSLNNIENDILRPKYKDARIHFALNCAAKSCPPLLNKAWTAENLEKDLRARTVKFLNNDTYNQINKTSANISQIFNWYAADFGNLVGFINKHSAVDIGLNTKVNFNEYDWKLNGK